MKFTVAGHTERGQRDHNEDAIDWYATPRGDRALVMVADGMGGYAGGEVASALATEVFLYHMRDKVMGASDADAALEQMLTAARAAHHRLLAEQEAQPALSRMGTTLIAGLFMDRQLVLLHAGDSRCYRWRAGDLKRLTRDHTHVEEHGPSATGHSRHVLTRALGARQTFDFSVAVHTVVSGDRYVFCTDGASNVLSRRDWEEAAAHCKGAGNLAQLLAQRAKVRGSEDNISVLVTDAQ